MSRILNTQWFYIITLLLGVVFIYGQTAEFSLLACDDPSYTILCPFVKDGLSGANIYSAFFKQFCWGGIYMPLVSVSYMFDFSFFNGSPSALHIGSVVFHAVNAALLFVFLVRILRLETTDIGHEKSVGLFICFIATAFWALHPLRVESVAWVASRKDVMFTFFSLLGLHTWLNVVTGNKVKASSTLLVCASLFFMLCACLCKPTAMCFPFLAACIEGLFLRKPDWSFKILLRKSFKYIPFVGLAAATGLLATYSQTHCDGTTDIQLYVGTFSWRLQNALVSLGMQLKHVLLPTDLTYYYRPNYSGTPFNAMTGYLTLAIAGSVYLWLLKEFSKYRTGLIWCGIFYLISLAPTLGIAASFGRQAYADRFTYVPMIGFSILMVWVYAKLKKGILGRRIVLTLMSVGLVGVVVLYAVISKEYTATFRDELTASKRVLSVDDLNADALRVIGGAILMEKDDPSEAIHYFRQAIAVDPYHQAGLDLIFALRKRGRPEDLIEYENLTKQIRENPYADGHGLVLSMLAEDAVKKGDMKEARKFFTAMAEASNPVFSEKARQWLRTNP